METLFLSNYTPVELIKPRPGHTPFTLRQERAWQLIAEYDFSFVRERIEDDGSLSASLIEQAILEFRKFLCLSVLSKDLAMISETVDMVWHNFILFTREYTSFCEKVFGAYLHHTPATRVEKAQGVQKGLWNFAELYYLHYGKLEGVWPEVVPAFWYLLKAMGN